MLCDTYSAADMLTMRGDDAPGSAGCDSEMKAEPCSSSFIGI